MISFKSFLTEARMAPLYHGTDAGGLVNILKDNTLKTGFEHEFHPSKTGKVVSLTRDFKFASRWQGGPEYTLVIELDQQKLAQRYKIVPFNFYGIKPKNRWTANRETKARWYPDTYEEGGVRDYRHENQSEEDVTTDIKNIDRYIIRIMVSYDKYQQMVSARMRGDDIYDVILTHPKLWIYDRNRWANQ